MKLYGSHDDNRGLTLIELIIVVAIVAVFALLMLPTHPHSEKSPVVYCMSNLKQIGLAETMWAGDYKSDFPARISTNKEGLLEYLTSGRVDSHFRVLAPYLPSPETFRCPADQRPAVTNYTDLKNANISYFASLDASVSNPASIIAGDRNLIINGVAAHPGMGILAATNSVEWAKELHGLKPIQPGGNLLFADGHVEFVPVSRISAKIFLSGTNVNRLVFP